MPNPDTIAAAYRVQTSMAAARAVPPIAAIVIPSVTASAAPTRAIKSEPGIAATANIASGNPIRSPAVALARQKAQRKSPSRNGGMRGRARCRPMLGFGG